MIYKAYLHIANDDNNAVDGFEGVIIDIEAESFDEAKDKLIEIITKKYSYDEYHLQFAELVEVSNSYKPDLLSLYNKIHAEKFEAEEKRKEDEERKELQRLMEKYVLTPAEKPDVSARLNENAATL